MKAFTAVLILVLAAAFLAGTTFAEAKFVGTKSCAMCHKAKDKGEAFVIWQKSAHANAFKTLESDAAKKIAKDKGLTKAPAEAPECLSCHVTGGGTAKNVEATFDMKEGVTCEACHGPASAFKMIHTKAENKAKAIEAGLITGDKAKNCETCHNAKSPTFKGFKMAEMWAKIGHKLPAKK
jgi:hypothetical protein